MDSHPHCRSWYRIEQRCEGGTRAALDGRMEADDVDVANTWLDALGHVGISRQRDRVAIWTGVATLDMAMWRSRQIC